MKALREFQRPLKEHNVQIYVRRAGPNYQEGLRVMRETGLPLMPFLIEELCLAYLPIALP